MEKRSGRQSSSPTRLTAKEKPEMVKGFEELRVRHLAWSFDGENLAYTSGATTQEILLIENFK